MKQADLAKFNFWLGPLLSLMGGTLLTAYCIYWYKGASVSGFDIATAMGFLIYGAFLRIDAQETLRSGVTSRKWVGKAVGTLLQLVGVLGIGIKRGIFPPLFLFLLAVFAVLFLAFCMFAIWKQKPASR